MTTATATEIKRPTIAGGPWWMVEEAAERICVSEQTLHNWRSQKLKGRPRGTRLGRRVWYSESELAAYVKRQQEKG